MSPFMPAQVGQMEKRRRRKIVSSLFAVTGLLAALIGAACANITVVNGDYSGVLVGWAILTVIATAFLGFAIRLGGGWVRWIAIALLLTTWVAGMDVAARLIEVFSS
jgi:hypothetical protein